MTAPRVPLTTPRGRRAAPVAVPIATAMFDALSRASDEKAAAQAAQVAESRALAEQERKRAMEDTRLRLDLDKGGYRIADPTAERAIDEVDIGPSPLGTGTLRRVDSTLTAKRKAKDALERLQQRDPEKWREEVADFDYTAAEVQEQAIDELSEQLKNSGMFGAMNPAQLRAVAASTMNKNPEVRGLMEAAVKAQMPQAPAPPRARRTVYDKDRGVILDLETGEVITPKGLPPSSQGGTGGQPLLKTSTDRSKLAGYDSGLALLEDLNQTIKGNPYAIGLKGYVPGLLLNRMSWDGWKEGAGTRSAIEAVAGEIRNSRFGGALTPGEAGYALRQLPDATDASETAAAKIEATIKYVKAKRAAFLRANGIDPDSGTGERDEIPPTGPDDVDAELNDILSGIGQ